VDEAVGRADAADIVVGKFCQDAGGGELQLGAQLSPHTLIAEAALID
jgi:hypothetical protein